MPRWSSTLSPRWRDVLLFRDYLRAHADDRERYGARKLAAIASGATTLCDTWKRRPAPSSRSSTARQWASSAGRKRGPSLPSDRAPRLLLVDREGLRLFCAPLCAYVH
jgi:hypothetical protein